MITVFNAKASNFVKTPGGVIAHSDGAEIPQGDAIGDEEPSIDPKQRGGPATAISVGHIVEIKTAHR